MFWGAGISYEAGLRDPLLRAQPEAAPELLEIVPADFFGQPGELDDLAERWPLLMHGNGASLGSVDGPSREWLAGVAEVVDRARPLVMSAFVAMTRSPSGIDLGSPVPLWMTHEQLEVVVANVDAIAGAVRLPVALENFSSSMRFEPADFDEPEFLTALTRRTRCGLHLHLGALVAQARARGIDPRSWLDRYPLERVWIVHVDEAPGSDDGLFEMLGMLRGRADVRGIVVDGDGDGTLGTRVTRARRARRVWTHGAATA